MTGSGQNRPRSSEYPYVLVVRHGQTEYNLQKRFQGQLDVALNETGFQQAQQSAETILRLLRDLPQAEGSSCRLITSDLLRASQTASAIHALLLKSFDPRIAFSVDELLREQHVGILQGHTLDEFHSVFPDAALEYEREMKLDPYRYRPEKGESKIDVAMRLTRFLRENFLPPIREKKPEILICVSHGWTINTLLELMSVHLAHPESYIGNGDVVLAHESAEATHRMSPLALQHEVGVKWNLLEHVAVGETISGLSFHRKTA